MQGITGGSESGVFQLLQRITFVGRVSAFPSIARLLVLLGYVGATEKMI
jgi:hypothetical protein